MWNGRLRPLGDLREEYGEFPMDTWRYQQLQHFCTAHLREIGKEEPLSDFKSLWHKQPGDGGLLSMSHGLLNRHSVTTGLRFFGKWEVRPPFHRLTEKEYVKTSTYIFYKYKNTGNK